MKLSIGSDILAMGLTPGHFKLISLSLEKEKYRLLELDIAAADLQFQAIHFVIQVLDDKLALITGRFSSVVESMWQ